MPAFPIQSSRPLLIGLIALASFFAMPAQGAPDLPTVPQLELQRYLGRWYEVARLPNRFERECVSDVSALYRPLPEGRLSVLNQCRKADGSMLSAEGVAKRAEPNGSPSRLKVRFAPAWLGWLPLVWGDYWVLALADDYSWSLVGAPSREYLWILARTPRLDQARIDALLEHARKLGFDTAKIELVSNPSVQPD